MGRTVFNGGSLDELNDRIGALSVDAKPLWGSLDATRMLRHLRLSFELPYPDPKRPVPPAQLLRKPLAWMFLGPVPLPKGAKAPPEFTPPCDPAEFEEQREKLLGELDAFVENGPLPLTGVHPVFGPLSGNQWGRLMYKHAVHHLKQFGV